MERAKQRIGLSASAIVFGLALWLSACGHRVELPAGLLAAQKNLPQRVDYNLHVKPILSDRCFACHGPDANKQQAGLRLDVADNAYAALKKSGHIAIRPGDVGGSELVRRIVSTDPEEVMPTPRSNMSLTDEEKAVLVKWIEQGAEYKPHWSLVAPKMADMPNVSNEVGPRSVGPRSVGPRPAWVRNDIDRFVVDRLTEKKLTPAPEADPATLLRRVSLDLTGLPPTPAEVDAFLADKSVDAYEKVVNRLLTSPHYGERMAVDWLDAARYADTHGYQDDGLRTMWPYRDFVIRAFNKNLSFGTFIRWQLAGDLLPKSPSAGVNRAMLIATGFNRNHPQSQEGGIVPVEYEATYISDRTDTFGKAMLGLTVECARCHDHKYDPISQKDYYALGAFFAQNNDYGQIPYNGEPSPHITLPESPAVEAQLNFIRQHIRPLDQTQTIAGATRQRFARWLAAPALGTTPKPTAVPDPADRDLLVYVPFDQFIDKKEKQDNKPTLRRVFTNRANDTLPMETHGDLDFRIPSVAGARGQGVKLVGESFLELKGVGDWKKLKARQPTWFERNEPFTVSLWVNVNDVKLTGRLFSRNLGPFSGFRGYECVRQADGRLAFRLSNVWPDDAIDLETTTKLPLNQWTLVSLTYDGSSRADGLHVYLNGQPQPTRTVTDNLTQSLVWGKNKTAWGSAGAENFTIGHLHDQSYKGFSVDELRVYARKLTPLEVQSLFTGQDNLRLARQKRQRTPAEETALLDYFLTNVDRPTQENRLARQQWLGRETDLLNTQPDVMVMHERQTPRPTFILKRGAYDAPGERVQPGILHSLNQLPEGPKNRLNLAQWLLARENPLFSRVMVNRFWQQCFGQGLAKNPDDFGNQGALPSHPELLDYLAVRFRDGANDNNQPTGPWNVKALLKLIVLSATYRQSSSVSASAREADLDNTWLSRGPSYRLSAEQIRDNVLTASGLLNQKIGGPSVKPYQPSGIWEALATRNAVSYNQNHGDSLYRRSLYTIWKRSSPPPMMLNFDAAERHSCIVKRQKTSTPLQALVTLNDPQFVEAARVLAQEEGGKGKGGEKGGRGREGEGDWTINQFFKALVSRPARPREVQLLNQLYASELADFRRNPKRANALLAVGEYPLNKSRDPAELAAWTVVASTIMNFDEAIIKR